MSEGRTRSLVSAPAAWLPGYGAWRFDGGPRYEFASGARREKASGRALTVLVVEDDSTIADMYRVQLEYDGYTVTIVPTGDAAMTAMAAARPDIILLDVLLPDRSGLEVLLDMKQSNVDLPPVVILSNYGEPGMIERGLALGAVEYLVKSRVTPAAVSRSIPEWVERGRGAEPPPQQ